MIAVELSSDADITAYTPELSGVTTVVIRDCPKLKTLDLSAGVGSLTVTIEGCPRLEQLRLPERGAAESTVRLLNLERLAALCIDGHVTRFEVSGPGFEWSMPSIHGLPHVSRVRVGAVYPRDDIETGVNVILGPSIDGGGRVRDIHLSPNAKIVAILNDTRVESLRIHLDTWVDISVVAAPALREITLVAPRGQLTVRGAPNLTDIFGNGKILALHPRTAAVPQVEVHGVWRTLRLVGIEAQLVLAPLVDSVSIADCPRVTQLRTRPHATLAATNMSPDFRRLAERMRWADVGALCSYVLAKRGAGGEEALLAWAVRARTTEDIMFGLSAITHLADAMPDPRVAWRARSDLYARHRDSTADSWWRSSLHPGAHAALVADLRLFTRCAPLTGDAATFLDALRRADSPCQIAAWLAWRTDALARGENPDALGVDSAFLQALRGEGMSPSTGQEPRVGVDLAASVLSLGACAADSRAGELQLAFTTWLARWGAGSRGLEALGALAARGFKPALEGLLSVSRDGRLPAAARGRALALALRPLAVGAP